MMRDKKDKPWKAEYREKLVSADEAVSHIRSGQRIVFSNAAGESLVLSDALVRNRALFENVEIVHMVAMGEAKYCEPGMEKHFRHNSFFLGASTRKAAKEGRADVTPVYFSEVTELFRTTLPVDAVFLNLSPPDEHGYCSFGISVDYSKPAAMEAELVIAQINPSMPRTLGDSFIHISDIDYIVEADTPLIELPPAGISEVERAIGKNCASLIEDGDTLQLGIGAIPDAVLGFLKEKKDLGIHSEMISDGIVELYEGGVITNRRKSLHAGKSIVTFLMGTRKLYDFADNNPAVELHPVDYVNDPYVIAQNERLVSVNSCVQVDLMGQIVSASVGRRQISGVGGQVDFVRGANMSRGGKSIMAMPSTAAEGRISKIVPVIGEGAAVTTSRYDADYIVTEYGAARLKGESLRNRAKMLIRIAHPDFRRMLAEEYEKRFREAWSDDE
ncbi:acetyl-CoA hydrolase/transferase family protein [Anaerostipes caccae]|jgi:4-hydroxybutyrate CoA-transferase|uniref:acetyl-CoA hydrolase/transferase family protein n=2 Tax=Anaerostipes caccae TaxID=105841 RepID=UPI001D06ADBC|nr:acetyl-CoA hydrolase/transferase C-terminal domain-containing protein [Anaerostipes caccae]MCB6295507.1 4-hydroxybutyrate CoA-transferase [Anaerostipes caccae]MCB6335218.1 4-hydroxybutyrate CoA-transferase [Anaerostipes caccae]MCB6338322.1 4-hydroxybutyrate CoA-transferase [Anaerostipes caccae]MCB6352754.1 4-hydroxybutyrate CoA-transferase [Anaerostipes caccae]MCB6358621.1 4-hydroxybutyrate CoA-transferase [Anaerostipes caccae]